MECEWAKPMKHVMCVCVCVDICIFFPEKVPFFAFRKNDDFFSKKVKKKFYGDLKSREKRQENFTTKKLREKCHFVYEL